MYLLFQNNQLLYANDNFLVLAARSLFSNKQYSICETILNKQNDMMDIMTNPKLKSVKLLIFGKCLEALEKKRTAASYYVESLKCDPTNVEALNLLMESYLISLPESRLFFPLRRPILEHDPVFER